MDRQIIDMAQDGRVGQVCLRAPNSSIAGYTNRDPRNKDWGSGRQPRRMTRRIVAYSPLVRCPTWTSCLHDSPMCLARVFTVTRRVRCSFAERNSGLAHDGVSDLAQQCPKGSLLRRPSIAARNMASLCIARLLQLLLASF
jgi:hypothetical protein